MWLFQLQSEYTHLNGFDQFSNPDKPAKGVKSQKQTAFEVICHYSVLSDKRETTS